MFVPLPPRRLRAAFIITFVALALLYLGSSSIPISVPVPAAVKEHLPANMPHPQLPESLQSLNLFKAPTHKPPPEQANSSSGDTTWHVDWRWKNPFSYSITLDENRAVLPPLRTRPPVYTFYETSLKTPKEVRDAEEHVLYQWRRAWWAQGFKPVVLGRSEALQNPLYKKVQMLELEDNIEVELARWLAWGNMGSGVLANWHTFPMAGYENILLAFLRRGQFPRLTRYEGMHNGLYCGEKAAINDAIEKAITNTELKKALSLADPMFSELFLIDKDHDGVAFYDQITISKSYQTVALPLFGGKRAKGYGLLADLINSHLHTTWQSTFSDISVLKPLPTNMDVLVDPALDIARNLTACPSNNPMPEACPPNRPHCKKCVSSHPVSVSTPPSFRNKTDKFYIGTVPHPYTTLLLAHGREDVDPAFVRQIGFDGRDIWLTAATQDSGTTAASNPNRISELKAVVAGDWAAGRALWMTAEDGIDTAELSWIFGFKVPHSDREVQEEEETKSETPVSPKPEQRRKPVLSAPKAVAPKSPVDELELERRRLARGREVIRSKMGRLVKKREVVEAWNLADMEAWRFIRAFTARRIMQRKAWENDEKKFAGAAKRTSGWGRWFD